MTDRGYRSTKFVLLGGMLLYWIAGNMLFSEIHDLEGEETPSNETK